LGIALKKAELVVAKSRHAALPVGSLVVAVDEIRVLVDSEFAALVARRKKAGGDLTVSFVVPPTAAAAAGGGTEESGGAAAADEDEQEDTYEVLIDLREPLGMTIRKGTMLVGTVKVGGQSERSGVVPASELRTLNGSRLSSQGELMSRLIPLRDGGGRSAVVKLGFTMPAGQARASEGLTAGL